MFRSSVAILVFVAVGVLGIGVSLGYLAGRLHAPEPYFQTVKVTGVPLVARDVIYVIDTRTGQFVRKVEVFWAGGEGDITDINKANQ